MAAVTTMNISTVLTDAEESITPVVKEVERTFCFTDVPCGAMKVVSDQPKSASDSEDISKNIFSFCGGLERAFCFSDLQDIDAKDIERIKSMKSNLESESPQKDDPPAVEPADTESLSDDSAAKEEELPAVKKDEPVKEEKPVEPAATKTAQPTANPTEEQKTEVIKKPESTTLPPANALQAATHKTKEDKPMNALQAAKIAKKKEGKKKGWSLFRRSSKKTTA